MSGLGNKTCFSKMTVCVEGTSIGHHYQHTRLSLRVLWCMCIDPFNHSPFLAKKHALFQFEVRTVNSNLYGIEHMHVKHLEHCVVDIFVCCFL